MSRVCQRLRQQECIWRSRSGRRSSVSVIATNPPAVKNYLERLFQRLCKRECEFVEPGPARCRNTGLLYSRRISQRGAGGAKKTSTWGDRTDSTSDERPVRPALSDAWHECCRYAATARRSVTHCGSVCESADFLARDARSRRSADFSRSFGRRLRHDDELELHSGRVLPSDRRRERAHLVRDRENTEALFARSVLCRKFKRLPTRHRGNGGPVHGCGDPRSDDERSYS